MSLRTAIELSPLISRVVRVAVPTPWRAAGADTRVESFAAMPLANLSMRQRLSELRRRRASVIVWGVPSDHRQVEVSSSSLTRMRADAIKQLRDLTGGVPIDVNRVLVEIAPLGPAPTRRVLVAMADAALVRTAVQPLLDAGLRVDRIMTPALALMSLARMRRALSAPGVLEAYVALEETHTCLALVRDGALVAAREVAWGFLEAGPSPKRPLRPRLQVVARLGDELAAMFEGAARGEHVAQVCVCGGLPDLRSTTLPLMERFDIEVETLDSMSGIDAAHLPEPAAEFRDRVAELRLAWAVASDVHAPLDLRRPARRRAARVALSRAAAVAGAAVALGAGVGVVRSEWWKSAWTRPRAAVAQRQPLSSDRSARLQPRPAQAPSVRGPERAALRPTEVAPSASPERAALRPTEVAPSASPERAAVRQTEVASSAMPERAAAQATEAAGSAPPRPTAGPPAADSRRAGLSGPPVRGPERAALRPTKIPTPLPFDATLASILYAPDRKLAIVDGRIVGLGDHVKGATVVDITQTAVLLRDAGGRLWQLVLTGR